MAATDGTPPATPAAAGDTASNMQVVVYVRPLLRSEIASGCKDSAWGVSGGEMWQQKASRARSAPPSHPPYRFDRIYGPDEGVAALHSEKVSRIVQQAMGGYHGAVLAYGQTASGKTTMVRGSVGVRDEGLITRCVDQLLTAFAAEEEPSRYSLHLSYLEVYNEVRAAHAFSLSLTAHMLTPSLSLSLLTWLHTHRSLSPSLPHGATLCAHLACMRLGRRWWATCSRERAA